MLLALVTFLSGLTVQQLVGLELPEALERLRDDGIKLVYSSRLVKPNMVVEEEPERDSDSDRELLQALLSPHGLTVKEGPNGTWIVVRRAPKGNETTKIERDPASAHEPFSLSALPRFHQDVEVNAHRETELIGLGSFPIDVAVVKDVAGSADNPFRALATLPGVTPVSEYGSRLSIRGGAPDQNLVVLDGVELYNPYRLHGIASALHPETLESFELASSGFGAHYGDRLSSVLAVETRRGADDSYLAGALDLSVTDATVVLEGKLPGERPGSWLVSGRRTYYDLALETAFDAEFPFFSDLQTRWSWSPRPGQELSFTGLVGKEDMRLRPEQLDAADPSSSDENFEIGGTSRTKLFAFNFDTTMGTRLRSRTTLSFHEFTDAFDIIGSLRSSAFESRNENPLADLSFTRGFDVEDKALRQSFRFDWRERHDLGFGLEAHVLRTEWRYRVGDLRSEAAPTAKSVSLESVGLPGSSLPARLDSRVDSMRGGMWIEDSIRWNRRLTIVPGLRLDHSSLNGRTSLSPRFQGSYRLSSETRFRFEAGLYHQSPGYEKLFLADRFVDLSEPAARKGLENERAFVLSLGFDQSIAPDTSFRFDAYHKSFTGLTLGRLETEAERLARVDEYDFPPELAPQIPTERRLTVHPVSDGRGSAWGFDASIQRGAGSWLTGWVSYSFLVANQTAYGRRFPFDYDATHRASFVARARLTDSMSLSFTGNVARGFPRTPALVPRVAATRDAVGRLVPMTDAWGELVYTPDFGDVSNLGSARSPAFARLDLRFSYHTGGGEGRFIWYVEVLNLLNRANTSVVEPRVRFDRGVPRIEEELVGSLPRLPSFGFRFRF